jgi:DNA-binding response OmpR family regulator
MPEMDGFLVLKKIRSSFLEASTTPIIMLTAKAQKDDVIRGLQKGADDYVLKPYKFPGLLAKINNLIG